MNQDKKDTQNNETIFNYGILKKDAYNSYIISKVQKISKALYLVTNFFDVREPIKWSIRDLSLKLVQSAMSLTLASLSHREKTVMDFIAIAQETDILIDTAGVSGFVSQMNAEVIKRELRGIVSFVEEKHQTNYSTSSNLMLTPGYFKAEEFLPVQKTVQKLEKTVSETVSQPEVKIAPTETIDRRKKVLDIGRTMSEFSIKDISSYITDCSEKTIQRLLIDMVSEGLLIKQGERRWSKYKLVK